MGHLRLFLIVVLAGIAWLGFGADVQGQILGRILFQIGSGCSGNLVQRWLMNEGSSPMADSSCHPNNLTNTNVTYTSISGLLSNTATYNGTTSGTLAANATFTNFTGSTPFTACGWVNQTTVTGGVAMVYISTLAPSGGASPYQGWEILKGATVPATLDFGFVRFKLISSYPTNYLDVYSGYVPTGGTTFHVCVATDGTETASGVSFYINGTFAPQNGPPHSNSLSGSTASGIPVNLGYRSADSTDYLQGGMADWCIYNLALDSAQISRVFAAGVSGCPNYPGPP